MENSLENSQTKVYSDSNTESIESAPLDSFVKDLTEVLPKVSKFCWLKVHLQENQIEEIKEEQKQSDEFYAALNLDELQHKADEQDQTKDENDEFKDAKDKIEIFYDLQKARQLKEKANEDFKEERFDECIRLYDQAIELCPPEEITDLSIFHNNKGICYTKLKRNEAKKEFSKAIEIKPDYVKPRAFRMKIYRDEEEYDAALEDAKKIEELDPLYPNIHRTVMELDKLQKEKFEKMKTEVMSNLKSFGNTILGKFGMSLDNFKLNQNQDGTYNINYQNQ